MNRRGFNISSKLSASQIRTLQQLGAGRVLREFAAPGGFIRHELDGVTVQSPIVKSLRYHYWIREQLPGAWVITGRGRTALEHENFDPKAPLAMPCEQRLTEAISAPVRGVGGSDMSAGEDDISLLVQAAPATGSQL